MLTQTAIFGDGEVEPSKDTAVCICVETCRCGLPKLLANKLALLDFEARKDAAQARVCCRPLFRELPAPTFLQHWGRLKCCYEDYRVGGAA